MPARSGSVEKGFETSRNCFNLSTHSSLQKFCTALACATLSPRTTKPHGAWVPSCPCTALPFSAKHIGTPGAVPQRRLPAKQGREELAAPGRRDSVPWCCLSLGLKPGGDTCRAWISSAAQSPVAPPGQQHVCQC